MAQSGSRRGGIYIKEDEAEASTKAERCMYRHWLLALWPSSVPVPTLCANPDECVRRPVGSSSLSPGEDRAERKPRISPSTVCRSILRQCPVIQKEYLHVAPINPVNMSLALSYCQANDPVGRWQEQNTLKPNSVICNLWQELMELTSKSFVCVCVGIYLGVEWSCFLLLLVGFFFVVVVVIVLSKWTLK